MLHTLCIGRWGQRRWSLCSGLSCGLETQGGSCLGPLAAEAPSPTPAPSRSRLHPQRRPTSGRRCLEITSFLSSLPFSGPEGRQRPDLSLCLVRPDSGPASRPLGTMGRVGSNSERRGLWWAQPLRNLAHPQGPSRRAVDTRVASSGRGAPACLSPWRRARPGLRAADIHQESVGWIQRGAEGRQWRPKTWASRCWGV